MFGLCIRREMVGNLCYVDVVGVRRRSLFSDSFALFIDLLMFYLTRSELAGSVTASQVAVSAIVYTAVFLFG